MYVMMKDGREGKALVLIIYNLKYVPPLNTQIPQNELLHKGSLVLRDYLKAHTQA